MRCFNYSLIHTGGASLTSRACSHHWAARRRLASENRSDANCTPSGRPELERPEGTVIAGNPPNVQGVWNAGSPVLSSPLGAGAGVDDVRSTSKSAIAFSTSRRNLCCTRRECAYVTARVAIPVSIRARTLGP